MRLDLRSLLQEAAIENVSAKCFRHSNGIKHTFSVSNSAQLMLLYNLAQFCDYSFQALMNGECSVLKPVGIGKLIRENSHVMCGVIAQFYHVFCYCINFTKPITPWQQELFCCLLLVCGCGTIYHLTYHTMLAMHNSSGNVKHSGWKLTGDNTSWLFVHFRSTLTYLFCMTGGNGGHKHGCHGREIR